MATDSRTLSHLNQLYQINRDAEKGFATVAANVKNRGLKVLLKTYAQQRAQLAEELKQTAEKLGGSVGGAGNLFAMVHRGRMHFYATFLTDEFSTENVLLGEAVFGEGIAQGAYQRVLGASMSPDIRALLERQLKQIQAVGATLNQMRGQGAKRTIVRLFNTEADLQTATRAVVSAGITPENLDLMDLKDVTTIYTGVGSTTEDVLLAGVVGGALWGGIIGAVAGASAASAPGMPLVGGSAFGTWAVITLAGLVLGALGASVLGFAISTGISEEDSFVYEDSLKHGAKLAQLTVASNRAKQAAEIMHQVNLAARAGH